jgi:DNA-binding transcriptional LysR family regulator
MDVLRSFVTVAELGTVTRTGDVLGRSQPAISLQLKRLDEMLESNLFKRDGTRLALTADGKRLYDYARRILAINDEAVADITQTGVTGRIRFGIPSEFAPTLLPQILGRFSKAYPGISLEINCDLSKNLLSEKSDAYDLILALEKPSRARRNAAVIEEDIVWVGASKSYSKSGDILPLVVAKEPCIYRERMLDQLQSAGIPWEIVYTSSDLTGIVAALKEELGITAMTRQTVPDALEVLSSSKDLPALGKVGINLIYDRKSSDEALLKLVSHVRESLG